MSTPKRRKDIRTFEQKIADSLNRYGEPTLDTIGVVLTELKAARRRDHDDG